MSLLAFALGVLGVLGAHSAGLAASGRPPRVLADGAAALLVTATVGRLIGISGLEPDRTGRAAV